MLQDAKSRHLIADLTVTVATLMATRDFDRLAAEARLLLDRGAMPADLREAAYLATLFCGFPTGVAALVVLARVDGGAPPHRDRPITDRVQLRARGEKLFHTIHKTNADRQLKMLDLIHPDLAETVLAEAYGRVLARDFLPLSCRELGAVAALAVFGLLPQLRAHMLAARNCGATWKDIERTLARVRELTAGDGETAAAQMANLRGRRRPA